MNSEEAKDILQLCRPDHAEDLDDPLIKEAFEKLEQDTELCVWFEEQQIADAAIFMELDRITPPAHLKTSILKGMQASVAPPDSNQTTAPKEDDLPEHATETSVTSKDDDSKIVWFRPWIGIAALFLFASVLLVFSLKEPASQVTSKSLPADLSLSTAGIPDFVQFLSQQIADFNGSKFDKRSQQVNELQSYLASYGMPSPAEIPQKL